MNKSSADAVTIFDVGPRDGLQNESLPVSYDDKIWLMEQLIVAGISEFEAGAFVRADRVPQMADSEKIATHFKSHTVQPWFLVPNLKGLERAVQNGVKKIAVFTAVSNTFNQKNIGMTVDESFDQIQAVCDEAKKQNIAIRGYVSTVWGCPFEGRISAKLAIQTLERMLSLPIDQLSIGDTIGIANPNGVQDVLSPLVQNHGPKKLAVHFHDTRGTALVNSLKAYDLGVRVFDASIGGLGGCPFAPGATGNLATEDLAYLFKEMGVSTGIDYAKLCEASVEFFKRIKKSLIVSKATQAYVANCNRGSVWDS